MDRFGDQLLVAHRRETAPVASPRIAGVLTGRRRRLSLAALAATFVVAVPAVAVIAPWEPSLERPGIDPPVATDRSPLAADATAALGVLRRDQTAADRERTAPLISAIGAGNQVDRVQTAGIRALGTGWALVPAKAMQTSPSARVDEDVLCITNGEAIGCSPSRNVRTTGVQLTLATASATEIAGVVPDGVANVRFTPTGGAAVTAKPSGNFYDLRIDQVAPERMIDAPPGSDGPARIPGPPAPASGTLQWLDVHGAVVGPEHQSLR